AGLYTADEPIPTAGSGETLMAPFTLPFTIEHQLDLAPPRPYMIVAEEAAIDRGEDMILGAQWDLYPNPGQQTLRIFQYFSESDEATTAWAPYGRPALGLAVSDLASVEPLELGTTTRAAFSLWAGFGGA